MRILVVSPVVPFPLDGGDKWRVFYLLKGLARSCNIDLLCLANESEPDSTQRAVLEGICHHVYWVRHNRRTDSIPRIFRCAASWRPFHVVAHQSEVFRSKLFALSRAMKYDLVQFEFLEMAQYLACIPAGITSVLSQHNFETEYWITKTRHSSAPPHRAFSALNTCRTYFYERRAIKKFDAAITVTRRDLQSMKRFCAGSTRLQVIPIGLDPDSCKYSCEDDLNDEPTICFIGTMHLHMNVDAVRYFYNRILPKIRDRIPDVRFLVVGKDPPDEVKALARDSAVEVTGTVQSVEPYIRKSNVLALPLRIGSGMKVKALQAMAFGKPIVATSLGAAGLQARHKEEIMLANTASQFADATTLLLSDKAFRTTMGQKAREHVMSRFDYRTIGDQLADWYRGLCG